MVVAGKERHGTITIVLIIGKHFMNRPMTDLNFGILLTLMYKVIIGQKM